MFFRRLCGNLIGIILEVFRKSGSDNENESNEETQPLLPNAGRLSRSNPISINCQTIPEEKQFSYEGKVLKRILSSEEYDDIFDVSHKTYFYNAYNKIRSTGSLCGTPKFLSFTGRKRHCRRASPRIKSDEENEEIFHMSLSEDEEQTTDL